MQSKNNRNFGHRRDKKHLPWTNEVVCPSCQLYWICQARLAVLESNGITSCSTDISSQRSPEPHSSPAVQPTKREHSYVAPNSGEPCRVGPASPVRSHPILMSLAALDFPRRLLLAQHPHTLHHTFNSRWLFPNIKNTDKATFLLLYIRHSLDRRGRPSSTPTA